MHPKTIGTIGELAVAKKLIQQGWEIFEEIGDDSKIDFIAYKNGLFKRVQVKTVITSPDGYVAITRKTGHQEEIVMADGVTKISANIPDEFIRMLKELATQRRTTMTEVLKTAIVTEKTLTDEVREGGRILVQAKDKSIKQLIR